MSRKRCKRRVRTVAINTLALVRAKTGKLTQDELACITIPMRASFDRLRRGQASVNDWCVLVGCQGMAESIEHQGVVRGLAEYLTAADRALAAIEARASASGGWRSPVLYPGEIDAISTFLDFHEFQLKQLSYTEFRRAYRRTEQMARQRGAEVKKLGRRTNHADPIEDGELMEA